jgi:DNA-binding IscR family transcriptional regulator
MSEAPGCPPSVDVRRHVVRLSGDQLLMTARLVSEAVDADMVTASIFLAISRANTLEIGRESQRTFVYTALEDIPPDDLRRPVSVYAVAREINIPYETARRHVAKLIEAGLCVKTGEGLLIPSEIYRRPALLKAAVENWRQVLGFLRDLAAVGVEAQPQPTPPPPGLDVRRQVLRLTVNMFLEAVEVLMARIGLDLVHTLLCITIVQMNVRHIAENPDVAAAYSGLLDIPPDEERRPVSVYAVAREMGLPYETARRHVRQMTEAGLLARDSGGGVWMLASVHNQADWIAGAEASWSQVQRLVEAFAQLGVTARTIPN